MTRRALFLSILLPALAVFGVDQATKWYILDVLDLPTVGRMEVVPPFFNLVMAWNTGINFGIGGGGPEAMRWILTGVSVVVSAGLVVWAALRGTLGLAIGAGVVAGGALGNALDRVLYGAVADFVNMSCCGIENPYAFNVADVAIFAGALLIAIRA